MGPKRLATIDPPSPLPAKQPHQETTTPGSTPEATASSASTATPTSPASCSAPASSARASSISVSFQLTFTAGPVQVGVGRLWSGLRCNTATIVGGPAANGIVLVQTDGAILASLQANKCYGSVVDFTHVRSAILPPHVVSRFAGVLVTTFKTTSMSELKYTQARRMWSTLTARLRLPTLNPYMKPPLNEASYSNDGSTLLVLPFGEPFVSGPFQKISAYVACTDINDVRVGEVHLAYDPDTPPVYCHLQHAQQSAVSETSSMLLAWEQREWPGSITTLPQDGAHARASLSPNPSVSCVINDRKVLPLILTVNQQQYPVCTNSPDVLRQLPGFFTDLSYDDVELRSAFCASRPFSIVGTATTHTIGRITFVTAFQQ
ncbi:hypothetical protein VOLCADRAFT_100619 [Volvox carteri f. nagariensis]|uniref:Uncharacterized protein n=1 Tax=Volvox carteri f. nagariensis TaxID=3068 RepID=D8UKN1_VOLCA|nr:uncharacterized protein VOLCADRAFT_100619 [Volvox carteri f. nagariensis]EFJ39718.1 hypothetical protein VOLCADRAFT_100619 [Volvox carteri f. nagariensis]|eukprot:XP_002959225.1 hypothetical protein VOLCADRAFT_100619 [Volvox carteri f. nagariensis]